MYTIAKIQTIAIGVERMGRKESTPEAEYYEQLWAFFGGQKRKIMEVFLNNPGKTFTVTEIAKKTGIAKPGTRVHELNLMGLIKRAEVRKGKNQLVNAYETAEHAIREFIRRMQSGGFVDKNSNATGNAHAG